MISEQNRRQKVFNRGALFLCRELDIVKIDKTPLICSTSYFNLRRLEDCLGVSPPTPSPRGDRTVSEAKKIERVKPIKFCHQTRIADCCS